MSPKRAAACCRPVDALLDPDWFRALCDPTRVLILACLLKCARRCAVTEVAQCCSVDLSVVSRHLGVLKRAGLVESHKRGRAVLYHASYSQTCDRLRQLAGAIEECCPPAQVARAATKMRAAKRSSTTT